MKINFFREKFLRKILAMIMALVLVVNSGGLALVYAEDPSPPVGGSGQVDPTPTLQAEPSGQAPQQTIETGGASSDTSSGTTANVNVDQVPGEITTPPGDCTPPEGQISCPVNNNNTADTSTGSNSSAQTGQNTSTGAAGNAGINTGDATASGSIDNNINNNVVEVTPQAETSGQALDLTTPTPGLTVNNTNEAVVQNNMDVSAGTGQNLAAENLGNVDIMSGNALAYANLFNLINTNIVGSNFEILVLNLVDQDGNIDLNALWQEILASQGQDHLVLASQTNTGNLSILVQNNNLADLGNRVDVTASTGQNEANNNGGNVSIQSGNATALANVTNVVNTNLVGSKFLLVFINILSSFNGDLILPRPELFMTDISGPEGQTSALAQNSQGGIQISQNQADISGNMSANADSGTNTTSNNQASNIVTGDANSTSTTLTFANVNIQRNNWFFLTVNNVGSWLGSLFGWSNPQSQETPTGEVNTFSLGMDTGSSSSQITPLGNPPGSISVENQNQATITNDISVNALTGQNQVNDNGEATVNTGKATALANLLNLANLNIFGGRWFMGMVNVLGNWQGNTVFAYPDVAINISGPSKEVVPGEEAFYNISFENKGYDVAQSAVVRLELPKGTIYVSDSSGVSPQVSGSSYTWNLGNIAVKTTSSFKVKVKIDSSLRPSDLLSFWQKIIPQAHAAEDDQKGNLIVRADVSTIDPQSNTANDSSQTTTTVSFPQENSNQEEAYGTPVLEITAKNNVGEFVYPGDTVTFELVLKNTGTGTAKNIVVTQTMHDGSIDGMGSAEFTVGDLLSGKLAKINFGLALTSDLVADIYTTAAVAQGQDQEGNEVGSNEGRTQFELKGHTLGLVTQTLAATGVDGTSDGQVPGGKSTIMPIRREEWMIYLLALLFGTFVLIEILKSKKFLSNLGLFKRRQMDFGHLVKIS